MGSKRIRRWTCRLLASCCGVLAAGCGSDHGLADRHLHPAIFSSAFHGGSAVDSGGQKVRFRVETLGRLKLTSGRLVAIEPFAVHQAPVFKVSIPPGTYPVSLAITDAPHDPRIAFAQIVFTDAPVAYWKLALPDRFDPKQLASGKVIGYAVDGGIGSFMDADIANSLATLAPGQGFNGALDALIAAPPSEPLRALLTAGDANVAVFASGVGDGYYASYFGFSPDGRAVALLTDFGLMPWNP